jgi:dTDP-glucose 4,6-dehydratase
LKILVTGCFGFIGYNFINSILKNNNGDFLLLGIDSLSSPYSRLNYKNLGESEHFKFYEEDICNISNLDFSNKDQIDLVINFAAESHVDTSIYNPSLFIKSNILCYK